MTGCNSHEPASHGRFAIIIGLSDRCDIAIVGAGAAGMAAGIFAAEAARAAATPARILLLDGAKTIGAKILVSGGGRCNVTHAVVRPEDYHAPRTLVRNILSAFNEKATVRWMQSLGVELKTEPTGKLFPNSDSARTVLAALLHRLQELGAELRPGQRVRQINSTPARPTPFELTIDHAPSIGARALILCTGGRSLPRTGSDGQGWAFARALGHSVTDTFPALVPLALDDALFHARVSGLSHPAELSTFVEGRRIDLRTGSLLWTHFGVSGPVVMDASRFWTIANGRGQTVDVRCSFCPGEPFEAIDAWQVQAAAARPRYSLLNLLSERLPQRLADAMLEHLRIDGSRVLSQVSRDDRRKLAHALTALSLPVKRDRGWNYAEVTAGGVPLEEIDFRTMQSRKTPGLYLAGEILDCDGRIGGFNFQWAWATGYLAGKAAATGLTVG